MLKYIFTFISFLSAVISSAQNPEYSWGGVYTDLDAPLNLTRSVVRDSEQSIYTVSVFAGIVDYDLEDSAVELTSEGSQSTAIVKHNPDGSLAWAHAYGAPDMFVQFNDLFIDGENNIFAVGFVCCGTVDYDLSIGEALVNANQNEQTIVIVKMDSDGNFIFVKTLQMHQYGGLGQLIFTDDGFIIGSGSFQGSVDFDMTDAVSAMNSEPYGFYNSFICKWNADFSLVWKKQIKCLDGFHYGQGAINMEQDQNGNLVIAGVFTDNCDFDPGAGEFIMTPNGLDDYTDYYVLKLNSEGEFLWAEHFGQTGTDYYIRLNMDGAGNIYLTGSFSYAFDVDPGAGTFMLENNGPSDGMFFVKWSPDAELIWARNISTNLSVILGTTAIALDNEYWIGGKFQGTLDFNPAPDQTNEMSTTQGSGFLLHLDLNGNYVWSGGLMSDISATVHDIAISSSDQMTVVGMFIGSVDLDPGVGVDNYTSVFADESFVAMFQLSPSSLVETKPSSLVKVYPNPCSTALTIELSNAESGIVEVYTVEGKMVMRTNVSSMKSTLDISNLTNGIYSLKCIQDDKVEVGRFAKQ
jgi:hypothetical protein